MEQVGLPIIHKIASLSARTWPTFFQRKWYRRFSSLRFLSQRATSTDLRLLQKRCGTYQKNLQTDDIRVPVSFLFVLEFLSKVKFWYSPSFLAIFALLFFSIIALKDLARPGFYTSHDGETHVARTAQYYQAITDGQIPPRWAKTLNGGLGSPIFVYIYPLPYVFGSVIHFFGLNFTSSFEILMALTFIFSGIFTFLWLREIFGSTRAAFIGALFYTWVPYRFSLIYVRGSISEALAYTFIPALLWSLTKLSKNINFKFTAISSLFFAAVLLSQNLVAYITLPVIAIYVLIISILHRSPRYFLTASLVALWGLLMSSVTYMPVIFERKLIHFDELFKNVYNSHFVTITQLIHSPWDYGFSLPGLNDSLSFQIGLAHILVVFLAILFLILLAFKKNLLDHKQIDKVQVTLTLFFLLTLFLSTSLMLENNLIRAFWNIFKPIQIVDIPWRFLGITSISTTFIAGFTAKIARSRFVFLFLIIAVLIANRNHLRINQQKFYGDEFFLNYQSSATQYNEFTPRTRYSTGISEDFVSRIESIKGNIKIYDLSQKSHYISFKTQNDVPARIQVNLINFKGWQVFMDGQKFINDPALVDRSYQFTYRPKVDTSGLHDSIVPAGHHNFVYKYKETLLRNVANTISIFSFTLAILVIAKRQHAKF